MREWKVGVNGIRMRPRFWWRWKANRLSADDILNSWVVSYTVKGYNQ